MGIARLTSVHPSARSRLLKAVQHRTGHLLKGCTDHRKRGPCAQDPFEVRFPRITLMESIGIDLPAPSPVRTFRPGLKCTSAFWITATFFNFQAAQHIFSPALFFIQCVSSVPSRSFFASRSDRATIRERVVAQSVPTTFFHCNASKTSHAALAMPE